MSEEELADLERLGTLVLADMGETTLSRLTAGDVARFGELLAVAVGTLRSVRGASLRPPEVSHG